MSAVGERERRNKLNAALRTLTDRIEWEGPDENDGEWPYPDQYVKTKATGELAQRVRAAFGVSDPDADVWLTELAESGGYSEFTQETDYLMTVACAGQSQEFGSHYTPHDDQLATRSGLTELLDWLDKSERTP